MKKILSILLIIILIITIIPNTVYADDNNEIQYQNIPDYYFEDCPEHGTIHTKVIQEKRMNREVLIWTPYDYNENIKYDVFVLLHGGGGDNTNWINYLWTIRRGTDYDTIRCYDIYDWITYEHKSKPFIICSITNNYYDREETAQDAIKAMKYIIDNYSTYAESNSDEDFINARNHFWIGGLSQGCISTYYFMSKYMKYVGNYICLSMSINYKADIKEQLEKNIINYIFLGVGINDKYNYANLMPRDVEFFEQYCDDIDFVKYGYSHDWSTWTNAIYDILTKSNLMRIDYNYITSFFDKVKIF